MADRRRAWRFGWRAETVCVLLLRLKGYGILARRFRSPAGEIDIVARRGRTLVFVEVKARASHDAALYAITGRQQARLARAAMAWIGAHPAQFAPQSGGSVRFDVMAVAPRRWPVHMVNAWQAEAADLQRVGW